MKSKSGIDGISKCMAVLIFSTCVITACSSGDGGDDGDVLQLSLTSTSDVPLGQSPNISASQYVKNGLYIINVQQRGTTSGNGGDSAAAAPEFSSTTTQVEGVDEADRIEYDGEYLYVANLPTWDSQPEAENRVRILKRQDDFSLDVVANIPLESEHEMMGMYLHDERLGVITRKFGYYPLVDAVAITSPWNSPDNDTKIQFIDVASPETPTIPHKIKIDGRLISSRRIGNDLYLAMQYVPSADNLPAIGNSNSSREAYYRRLLELDNSSLVPNITINEQSLPLYNLDDCLVPENASSKNGHVQMLSLVKINMSSPSTYSALCTIVEAEGLFMTHNNMYLHATQGNDTVIHKVSLENGIEYQATGKVRGSFGWNSSPQLKMSERDGYFMAVTTEGLLADNPEHFLHVLTQQGRKLEEVASLPNDNEPSPIGKPGEDVYAVRFFEDKAYVVTFEQVDPLYVIDLSDAEAPFISGELTIPGFSSYLHPMENGLLLGIGQQVIGTNIPEAGEQPMTTPVEDGMKVSLFDVLDPENPILLNEYVWSDTYTGAEYDYRALSVLKTQTGYRFALPSESWISDEGTFSLHYALQMLEVDSEDRTLSLVGSINHQQDNENYYGSYDDRSVLHNDHVYYLRGNKVYHALWQQEPPIDGPY